MASRQDDQRAAAARGLAYTRMAASDATPRYSESAVIAPTAVYGLDATATLKATFWDCMIEETPQAGDPDFVSIALNTGGGRVWRNSETTPTGAGAIAMQPFEGAHWRFEYPVSFVHLYAPFALLGAVCQGLYARDLRHDDLRMLSAITDQRLCAAAEHVQHGLRTIEPTNLILDSWSLILSEIIVRRFSSHSERPMRGSFGKIPGRGVAQVVDYVESNIDRDLRLATLADVAGMSVFHFAKRFRETVGVSPHAYVLHRRVRRAVQLLRRDRSGLAEIAVACGFASQAHFTTVFRRDTGVTPAEYRRHVCA